MNVSKQTGSVDCALYAMATLAHLAFGKDPTTAVLTCDLIYRVFLKIMPSLKLSQLEKRENQGVLLQRKRLVKYTAIVV